MSGGEEQGNTGDVVAVAGKRERRSYSKEWKRRVVQETLLPGVSVARIARARGINANQVFYWRKLYERGLLEGKKTKATGLLAVTISDSPANADQLARNASVHRDSPGIIHIELAKGRLRIEGEADASSLRVALECLLR